MNFWKGFGLGFSSYSKAISFIFKNNLAWFFVFPLILNISLFWAGTSLISMLIDYLESFLNESIGLNNAEFVGSEVLRTSISWIMYILFKLLYIVAFAYIGGKIVIIFMSPIFSILSEKVDKIITGENYPFSAEQMMRDIVRGILIAFRNIIIEFGIIALLFVLAYIPAIGWLIDLLGTIFLFVVTSYFYGFSFMDYSNERKKRNISQSVKYIRKNMGVAIGNGSIFAFTLIIPFCGTFIAGFVSIVSVVAATISMNKIDSN